MEPRYCSYCNGLCPHNNVNECPGKSVLKYCDVLKAKYKEVTNGHNDTWTEAV